MKLLSFELNKQEQWGAVIHQKVVNLSQVTGIKTLCEALEQLSLAEIEQLAQKNTAELALDNLCFLPVITNPKKIFCIGTNYHDHRIETGREVPDYPVIFSRFAKSQIGHNQPILRPLESEQLDFEGEIAIIIGKAGRRISKEDSWEYIAGYAPYCDGTIRDWQRHTHQWIPGKNFSATGAFGPWMVTRGEIEDNAELSLVTRLNGQEVQSTTSSLMIFSIPEIIHYCSQFIDLEVGDVIVTGTPGGVGGKRTPPLWMKDGDILEIEVGRVGTLVNPIKNEN